MSKYLSCAETAKLVRQALKEAFPGVKFGVRSSTYAGGASMNVTWTDGPNAAQVEAITDCFEGSVFDGMQDLKSYTSAMMDGEVVRFGADFIFTNRKFSEAMIERAITALWSENWADLQGITRPTADDWNQGRCNGVAWSAGGYDLNSRIWQKLCKRSDRLALPSNTAARVIYLGAPVGAGRGELDFSSEVAA